MSGLTIHLTPEASRALTRLTLALKRRARRLSITTSSLRRRLSSPRGLWRGITIHGRGKRSMRSARADSFAAPIVSLMAISAHCGNRRRGCAEARE
jgi:hypothetical protein